MDENHPVGIRNIHVSAVNVDFLPVLQDAPVPIAVYSEDGLFLLINREIQDTTGYSQKEIATFEDWDSCLRRGAAVPIEQHLGPVFEEEAGSHVVQMRVKTAAGETLRWECYLAPIGRTPEGLRVGMMIASDATRWADHEQRLEAEKSRLEEEVHSRTKDLNATISALMNEIEERKRMSEALSLSRERLKQVSRRTLNVLEADRKKVSKDLHDSIGASLAAIKFSLEEKEIKRAQNQGRLDDSLEQEISYLLAAIKETKRISANLRPTILDDLGLMATLKWYLRQFQRLYGNIRVDWTSEISEDDVPESMKIIIYRIVQEGLSNAEKHGNADHVRLHLKFTDEKHAICLSIEDNGQGFDPREAEAKKDPLSGYGLTAMRERCEIFGGSFRIESRIGHGAKIRATLPRYDDTLP